MSCGKSCECESYGAHLRTISFSAHAMPTRKGSQQVLAVNKTESGWDKDMPAYKRLRRDGFQPRHIDGSADFESRAVDKVEIEDGKYYGKDLSKVKDLKTALAESGNAK